MGDWTHWWIITSHRNYRFKYSSIPIAVNKCKCKIAFLVGANCRRWSFLLTVECVNLNGNSPFNISFKWHSDPPNLIKFYPAIHFVWCIVQVNIILHFLAKVALAFKLPLRPVLSTLVTSSVCYLFKTYGIITQRVKQEDLGAVSIRKTVLPGMAISMLKIRRPNGRLIFNMEIAIRR